MDNLEAWSFGGSILTFLVPMLAFTAVALALLILYTKPELVPGRLGGKHFPVTATRQPGMPAGSTAASETAASGTAASETAASDEAASAE
jgi:hypothetical protein